MKRIHDHLLSEFRPIKPLFAILIITLFIVGCSGAPKKFDATVSGPQMIVEPETISLGIAKLKDTKIVFRGKGFEPNDSVFVELLDVKKDDKVTDIPIADGNVDDRGYFTAEVGTLTKVTDFLRAKVGMNKDMENIIIVTNPPIPKGIYTARAVSMQSDKTAECKLEIKGPSFIDSIMDWLGELMGKIRKE